MDNIEPFQGTQICFQPKGSQVLLCNAVDLRHDGQLWAPKSGKWIPLPLLEDGKRKTVTTSLKQ